MQLSFPVEKWLIVGLTAFVSLISQPSRANDYNFLVFGGEGELYVPIPVENSTLDGDRLRIRSVELTSQADLSQWTPSLMGKLTLGAEDVSGDLTFNIREAYFVSSDIVNGLDLRVGKFYLPIGLLNQTRRSAWSLMSPPRPIALFLTDMGVVDTGADLYFHFRNFAVRAGLTNGYRFDSSVTNGGARPETPTHFARPEISIASARSTLVFAADYLARVDDTGESLRLVGVDASLSPLDVSPLSWSAQFEFYHRYQHPLNLAIVENIGGYAFTEKGLSEKYAAGLRFDYYQIPSLTDQNGVYRQNLTLAIAPVLTYRGHDHMKLQAGYSYLRETRDGNTTRAEQVFELRYVAEFGDIPKFRTPIHDQSSL